MGTIAERYEDDATFNELLTRINIPVRERNKLVNDGFTSLRLLVDQYYNFVIVENNTDFTKKNKYS